MHGCIVAAPASARPEIPRAILERAAAITAGWDATHLPLSIVLPARRGAGPRWPLLESMSADELDEAISVYGRRAQAAIDRYSRVPSRSTAKTGGWALAVMQLARKLREAATA